MRSQHDHEAAVLRALSLPGHVIVRVGSGWRRGWLIGRENGPDGWWGLVQYEDGDSEVTEYVPAARIAAPESWLVE